MSSQRSPVVFQQKQKFSVEWQSSLSQIRGTVVTDGSGGIGFSGSEWLRVFLRQRGLLEEVERVRAEEHEDFFKKGDITLEKMD